MKTFILSVASLVIGIGVGLSIHPASRALDLQKALNTGGITIDR